MNIWCRLPVSAGGQIPSRGHWPPPLWQEQLPDLFFCSSRFSLNRLLGRFSLLAALSALSVSVNAIAKHPLLVEGRIANIGLWSHNFLFVWVSMIFYAFQLFGFSGVWARLLWTWAGPLQVSVSKLRVALCRKKLHGKGTNTQTDTHTDFATTRPTQPRGPSWWKKHTQIHKRLETANIVDTLFDQKFPAHREGFFFAMVHTQRQITDIPT